MITQLFPFDAPTIDPRPDFRATDAGFAATTITVEPVSAAGRAWFEDRFGLGAVSATLPKGSGFPLFCTAVAGDGLTVQLV